MHIRFLTLFIVAAIVCCLSWPAPAAAQESGKKKRPLPPSPVELKQEAAKDPSDKDQPADATARKKRSNKRNEKLIEMLSGVKLIGHFTMAGKPTDDLRKEEYTISSVKPAGGKLWVFNTRIKYGQRDVTLPLVLPVEWIGDTPVIALSDFTIPGMGTFGARVVFDDGKYAGTWQHDAVGGHLFGVIEKLDDDGEETAAEPAEGESEDDSEGDS